MKRSLTVVCVLASAIGASSVALTNRAEAQSADPPSAPAPATSRASAGSSKVAVILFQQAVAQTNEGQRSFSSLQQKFAPKQTQLKTESDEIDSLKKQLQDAGATLSDEERANRTRAIDEKTKSLQRAAQDDQTDFSSEMNDLYQALAQKVFVVLDSYAKQQGYAVVLDASSQQSPVLWASPANDITKEIVDAYNAKSGVAPPPAGATTAPRTGTIRPAAPRSTRPGGSTTPR